MTEKTRDNTVFIGKKPTTSYVLAVVTQISGGYDEVHIKARGKAISKAVDVAEIVRNKFIKEATIKNIQIGTEEMEFDGRKTNVSTIEITLLN